MAADHTTAADASSLIARIESVPFSKWHLWPRVIMGSATFFDAFAALSLGFVMPILRPMWHITPQGVAWLLAITYAGQLVGALLFGWLAEKYGRVKSASAAVAVIGIFGLACGLVNSFSALFICRLIQGIGVGGEVPVAAVYVNELSKAKGRGKFFLLYEIIFPVGLMMTGQVAAILIPAFDPSLGWRVMFLLGGVPALLVSVLILRLPESPRWLLSKGRIAEAEAIVRDLEASTPERVTPIAAPAAPVRPAAKQGGGGWRELFSPFYFGRTMVVWALWATAYFVTNGLNNWMPTLYRDEYHLSLASSLRAGTLTNVAQVVCLLGCAFVIDRLGRRGWSVACFAAAAVALAVLGLFGAHSVVAVMTLVTLSYGILGSVNAVLYLYTPEIYPTRMRAIGTGWATAWLRAASFFGPLVLGYTVATVGIGAAFLMFAAVAALGVVAAAFMLETRNRRLEEIAP